MTGGVFFSKPLQANILIVLRKEAYFHTVSVGLGGSIVEVPFPSGGGGVKHFIKNIYNHTF